MDGWYGSNLELLTPPEMLPVVQNQPTKELLTFFPGLICKLPVGCFYRMDKNLNSTGRQTMKPTIINNYNASMMSLFVVVVS